jgi:hypothetical protein
LKCEGTVRKVKQGWRETELSDGRNREGYIERGGD